MNKFEGNPKRKEITSYFTKKQNELMKKLKVLTDEVK
jgi:hypothetical protein